MCVHACVCVCVYIWMHTGFVCQLLGVRNATLMMPGDSGFTSGKDGDESLGPRPSVDPLCIPVCHSWAAHFQVQQKMLFKDNGHPFASWHDCTLSNVLKWFWLWQKAPWLTHSIIYPMKIHALHKRHILTLSRLTSRFFLPPVSFRHLLRITLSNTSQLLLESYGGTVVSFSWQSVQLCQHIHCASHVPVVCKTPPIPSNDRCHQSRK